jgi:hypothetical protein
MFYVIYTHRQMLDTAFVVLNLYAHILGLHQIVIVNAHKVESLFVERCVVRIAADNSRCQARIFRAIPFSITTEAEKKLQAWREQI